MKIFHTNVQLKLIKVKKYSTGLFYQFIKILYNYIIPHKLRIELIYSSYIKYKTHEIL